MINKKRQILIITAFLLFSILLLQYGCKKIDLVRLAAVQTENVDNISSSQATVYGSVIDLGENESLTGFGFCWAMNKVPTISDQYYSYGATSTLGNYFFTISGLASSSNYSVRAYVVEGSKVTYGNTIEFMTDQGIGPNPVWIHYDDGTNADGIGLVNGGDFDVAIRIPASDLQDYEGYRVSRIRFYALSVFPVEYTVTIWEGSLPTLVYSEYVSNPIIDGWTNFYLSEDHMINTGLDLWVGYWIQNHAAGEYPAGTDDGPAIAGYGDLLSTDDGDSWSLLSDQGLNYNWNLQVYVTNEKGKEVQIVNKPLEINKQRDSSTRDESSVVVVSKSKSEN